MSSDTVFTADPPDQRIARLLPDGVTLVFHRPSGMTHILGSPAPELLDALGEGAADPETLLARLARNHDLGDPADALPALEARLAELEAAGLVWRG